jgi:hypothetical protein
MAENAQNEGKKKYTVKIDKDKEAGTYSNAVSVHVNGNEIVLDFAYSTPKMSQNSDSVIKVVSRVNMSHKTAESFLKVLSNALLDWRNKQSENSKK